MSRESHAGAEAPRDTTPGRTAHRVSQIVRKPTRLGRYEDLGLLARGGMGEVRRVRDGKLRRVLAMKIIGVHLGADPDMVNAFMREAIITAHLCHPGIVPVHETGFLPDGRAYFTMDVVEGRVLDAVIEDPTAPLRRRVETFRTACEAVAFAHARGVVHRDLKPANVLVGDYGQVRVVDWGLAAPLPGHAARWADLPRVRLGRTVGTAAYMSPEQAAGRASALAPTADVYSLGAILDHLLTGRAPYAECERGEQILLRLLEGPPPAARPAFVPVELWSIRERAMATDPAHRYADASALCGAVGEWLDGVRARGLALLEVRRARPLAEDARALRRRASELAEDARRWLDGVPTWADVAEKAPAWALEDEADDLRREAARRDLELGRRIGEALRACPDLPEARALLADHARDRHRAAERRGDHAEARRLEAIVRANDDGRHARYLEGDGELTLVTDTPARATLHTFVERGRRLVLEPAGDLGFTPLRAAPVPMGSHVIRLRAPGRAEVVYPVRVGRNGQWTGCPPGDTAPLVVRLPAPGDLGAFERYVPAGPFVYGGDRRAAHGARRERPWLGAFVIERDPVTVARFLELLDALVAEGREDEGAWLAPRGSDGELLVTRRGDGRFELTDPALGDAPVHGVTWHAACAFAAFHARRTGQPWRLPSELEWEKAARGVDGRAYPWGDRFDHSWCCVLGSRRLGGAPAPLGAFLVDDSVYGVRGMAGNVATWCHDVFDALTGARSVRGACFESDPAAARSCARGGRPPTDRAVGLGLRLVRSA